jgi:thioredoxin 1
MGTNSVHRVANLLIGGALLIAAALLFLRKPSLNIEPSQDPWFQSNVVSQERPVLVKFGAEWCGPCRSTDKALEEYQTDQTSIPIVRIDVDERPDLASHYGVRSIPRMFIFYRGRILDDQSGGMNTAAIANWVASTTKSLPK